jgi:hypothetical protein
MSSTDSSDEEDVGYIIILEEGNKKKKCWFIRISKKISAADYS